MRRRARHGAPATMEEALLEIGSDDEVTVDGESLDVADILRAQPTPDNGGVEVTTCARQSGWCATRARVLRTRTLRVRDGAATAKHLTQLSKRLSPDAPHKVLVVVNPAGGTGRAQKVFERDVAPVFYAANIEAERAKEQKKAKEEKKKAQAEFIGGIKAGLMSGIGAAK